MRNDKIIEDEALNQTCEVDNVFEGLEKCTECNKVSFTNSDDALCDTCRLKIKKVMPCGSKHLCVFCTNFFHQSCTLLSMDRDDEIYVSFEKELYKQEKDLKA